VRLLFSHGTDPGLVRSSNEDAYSLDMLDPRGCAALLIVADGMGGHEGGEVASRLAVETVRSRVAASAADWAERGMLAEGFLQSIDQANRAILQMQSQRPALSSMGSTVTAALIWGDRVIIGHIGDSGACLVNGDGVTKVTSDHNVAGELFLSGHITAEQAASHPQRNVLTRALGAAESIIVERRDLTVQVGDTLLLCTDGLSGLVSLAEIEVETQGEFTSLAERLVKIGNARGGHDNITVLAARWEG
jgi:serine/threonine protein phosphatase PrpC